MVGILSFDYKSVFLSISRWLKICTAEFWALL